MTAKKTQIRKRCRWAVYVIIGGSAQDCEYEGANRDCVRYVRRQRREGKSMEYIISPLY